MIGSSVRLIHGLRHQMIPIMSSMSEEMMMNMRNPLPVVLIHNGNAVNVATWIPNEEILTCRQQPRVQTLYNPLQMHLKHS